MKSEVEHVFYTVRVASVMEWAHFHPIKALIFSKAVKPYCSLDYCSTHPDSFMD